MSTRVTVCRPSELGDEEIDAWHRFQRERGLESPFLSPEFACDVDAVSPAARVAVVHDGGALAGFLAFERGPLRSARGIGGALANCQAFVGSGRAEIPIAAVLRGAGVDVFNFHALVPAPGGPGRGSTRPVAALTIDLSRDLEQYRAGLHQRGGRFVKELERKRRRLEREHPDAVSFAFATHDISAVRCLIRWKSAQYRRTGRPDPFSPRTQELIMRLVDRDGPALSGCVTSLTVDGRLVAVDVSLRSAAVLSGWFTSYSVAMARWSPGAVATLRLIEEAFGAGLRMLELGIGDEELKRRLADSSVHCSSGWIGRPSVSLLVDRTAHAPAAAAHRYIVARPRLRHLTRRALRQYGSLRTTLGR